MKLCGCTHHSHVNLAHYSYVRVGQLPPSSSVSHHSICNYLHNLVQINVFNLAYLSEVRVSIEVEALVAALLFCEIAWGGFLFFRLV